MPQYTSVHRRRDPETTRITPDTLVVAIDVAKYHPKALVCDYQGTILEAPFAFGPHQEGIRAVMHRTERWIPARAIQQVVVGLEATGHYHEPLVRAFRAHGWAVRILTPNTTAAERRADQRRSKTDPIDLLAIARCVLNDRGSERPLVDGIPQALRSISRARRAVVRQATRCKNLIRSVVDQTFLEYQGFVAAPEARPEPLFDLWSRAGRTWVQELPLPQDYAQLRRDDLTVLNRRNVLHLTEPILDRIWTAAARAFPVPAPVAPVWRDHLHRLFELLATTEVLVARYERDQEELLVQTDALLWLTVPGIGVVSAADLFGELGSALRFATGKQAVKYAGTDPTVHDSGERQGRYGIIRYEGHRWLRAAVTQVGDNLVDPAHRNPYFLTVADRLRTRGLRAQPIAIAAGNQFLHVGLAMLRQHQVFAPPTWAGPPLAMDWRPKIRTQAHRALATVTWTRVMAER